jgi:hypothetical protein
MTGAVEKTIEAGLSPWARYVIALFAFLFGAFMTLAAPSSAMPLGFYAFAGFCFLIALTCCMRGRLRQFLGSCIGLCLFFVACGYILQEMLFGPIFSGSRAAPSLFNSILFASTFGLPGLAYVLKVRFGIQRK